MYLVNGYNRSVFLTPMFVEECQMFKVPQSSIEASDKVEVWGTTFDDAGSDYCEWRFFKGDKEVAPRHRINGY